jgi:hypothetical protein
MIARTQSSPHLVQSYRWTEANYLQHGIYVWGRCKHESIVKFTLWYKMVLVPDFPCPLDSNSPFMRCSAKGRCRATSGDQSGTPGKKWGTIGNLVNGKRTIFLL